MADHHPPATSGRRTSSHVPADGGTPRPTLWGEQLQSKVDASRTGGAFTLDELSTAAGWHRAPYVDHRSDECFYVLAGSFRLDLDDRAEPLLAVPGDLAYVPRGVACAITQLGSGTGRLLVAQTPAPPTDPAAAGWSVELIGAPAGAIPPGVQPPRRTTP